jgi:hypothetical protein
MLFDEELVSAKAHTDCMNHIFHIVMGFHVHHQDTISAGTSMDSPESFSSISMSMLQSSVRFCLPDHRQLFLLVEHQEDDLAVGRLGIKFFAAFTVCPHICINLEMLQSGSPARIWLTISGRPCSRCGAIFMVHLAAASHTMDDGNVPGFFSIFREYLAGG